MYEERKYRDYSGSEELFKAIIVEEESDLLILSENQCEEKAKEILHKYRKQIKNYILIESKFAASLKPVLCLENSPEIIKHMCNSSRIANVGPMASVAGAVAEYVGKELLEYNNEIIIENGGDIFIKTNKKRKIKIFAGDSPFSNKISIIVEPEDTPIGICTSAGTVGHSFSLGKADAVVILSKDTLIADAVATAAGNIIKSPKDIDKGIDFIKSIDEVLGALIICKDKMGIWGKIEISR